MSASTSAAALSPPPGHLAYRDTTPPTDTESDSSDNSGDEIEQSLASIPLSAGRSRTHARAEAQRASLGRKRRSTTSRAVIKRRIVSNSSILGMTEDMSSLQTSPAAAADEVDSCLSDDLTDLAAYKPDPAHPVYRADEMSFAKKRPYDSKTARYRAGPSKRPQATDTARYRPAFKKRALTLDVARAAKPRQPDLSAWGTSAPTSDTHATLKEMAARAGFKLLPLSPRSHAAEMEKLGDTPTKPSTSSDFVDDVLLASAPSEDDESEIEAPDTPTPAPRKKIKTTPAPSPRRNLKSAGKGKARAQPLLKGKGRAEPLVLVAKPVEQATSEIKSVEPLPKRTSRKGKARADTVTSVRLNARGASARQRYAPTVPAAASHAAPRRVKQLSRERHYSFALPQSTASRPTKRPRLVFARRRVALRRPSRMRLQPSAERKRGADEVPLDTAGNGHWAAAKAHLVISRSRRGLYKRYQDRMSKASTGRVSAGPSTTPDVGPSRLPSVSRGNADTSSADGNDDDDLVDELLHEPGTDRLVGRKRSGASAPMSDGVSRKDVRNRARNAEEFGNYHVARRAYLSALADHRRDPDARRHAQAVRHLQAVAADREARYEQNRVDAELLEVDEPKDEDEPDVAADTVDVAVHELADEVVPEDVAVEEVALEEPIAEPSVEEPVAGVSVDAQLPEEASVPDDEVMAEPIPAEPATEEEVLAPADEVAGDAEDVAAILAAAAEPLSPPPRYEYPFEPIIRPVPRQLRPAPRVRRRAPSDPPRYVRELYNRRSPSPPPPYNAQTDRETVMPPVFLPEPAITAPVLPLGPPAALRHRRNPSPAASEASDDLRAPGTWPTRRTPPPPPHRTAWHDAEMGDLDDDVVPAARAGTFGAIRRWFGF